MTIDPVNMRLVLMQDMGPAGKAAHDAATQPEIAQTMAKAMAEEMLREQNQQIQKTEETKDADLVTDDGQGGGKQQFTQQERRKQEEEEEESPPANDNPFVGKLINKKV